MNKRNKIIVSIVGITIVLLALLGITYAYYLTRIEGNTNTNSISVTTADLKLEYSDGTVNILTKENIIPDNNNPIGTKDFSVTNTGNTTIDNYSVVLEYAVLDDITPSVFKYPNDFEITLTCVDDKGNICNNAKVNFNNESVTLTTASIEPNETHNYILTMYYLETGIDQSDDMGKNLNLKVQIYEVKETADIKGIITGVDETYIVKLNSNSKISTIVKNDDGSYRYSFNGIEMGTHTLSILNNNLEEISSEKIVIQKNDEVGFSTTIVNDIEVPLIKVNESNRVVKLRTNVNTTNNSVTNSGTGVDIFNPYEGNKNSLAYKILNKAQKVTEEQNATGLAKYFEKPITTPAKGEGNVVYTGYSDPTSFSNSSSYISKWYIYSNEISLDKDGFFKFINPQIGLYEQIVSNIRGSYISTYSGYSDETAAKKAMNNEFTNIYKVGDSTTESTLSYSKVIKNSENTENILSVDIDDYGNSFYYRGGVIDNYVNFAEMCWKIVRIEGDGSIKLILEDQNYECNNELFEGNWSIGEGNYGYDSSTKDSVGNTLVKMNYLEPVTEASSSMVKAFYDFQTNSKINKYIDNLKLENWCLGDNIYSRNGVSGSYTYTLLDDISFDDVSTQKFYYDSYTRIRNLNANGYHATYNCNGNIINNFVNVEFGGNILTREAPMYIGTLSVDEVLYAGGKFSEINENYYLLNDYAMTKYMSFWLFSPYAFNNGKDKVLFTYYDGEVYYSNMDDKDEYYVFRPSVSLAYNTQIISGDGTQNNPYTIG